MDSDARIEALNNKIKLIIRRAYGFRNIENLISMIRLACSEIGRQLQPAYVSDTDFEKKKTSSSARTCSRIASHLGPAKGRVR